MAKRIVTPAATPRDVVGEHVEVRLTTGGVVRGKLIRAGSDWLVLDCPLAPMLVRLEVVAILVLDRARWEAERSLTPKKGRVA